MHPESEEVPVCMDCWLAERLAGAARFAQSAGFVSGLREAMSVVYDCLCKLGLKRAALLVGRDAESLLLEHCRRERLGPFRDARKPDEDRGGS